MSQKEKQKKKSETVAGEEQIFLILKFMHFKLRSLQGTNAEPPIRAAEHSMCSPRTEKGDLNNTFETDSKYGLEERCSPGAFN